LIGLNVIQALVRRGRRVRAFVRSLDRSRALLPGGCEFAQGDITDPATQAMANVSEWLVRFTGKPPLIAVGQLHFRQWQVFPVSGKAQRELGWQPTPLREGLRQTIAYLRRA